MVMPTPQRRRRRAGRGRSSGPCARVFDPEARPGAPARLALAAAGDQLTSQAAQRRGDTITLAHPEGLLLAKSAGGQPPRVQRRARVRLDGPPDRIPGHKVGYLCCERFSR